MLSLAALNLLRLHHLKTRLEAGFARRFRQRRTSPDPISLEPAGNARL